MKKKNFLLPLLHMRKIPAHCLYPNSRLNLNDVPEEKFLRRLFISCFVAMVGQGLHISRGRRKRRVEPEKKNSDWKSLAQQVALRRLNQTEDDFFQ